MTSPVVTEEALLLRDIRRILMLAFHEQIREALDSLREDPVVAAILDILQDGPTASPELQQQVSERCSVSERTVRNRLADLGELGVVETDRSRRPPTCTLTRVMR